MREATDHAPFREALPIGFARSPDVLAEEMAPRSDEFRAWFDKAAGPEAAGSFAREFWSRRRPILDGQLVQVAGLADLDPTSVLRRRPDSVFEVSREGAEATLLLGTRELLMPGFVEPVLRYIAEAKSFSASDLPGDLDADSRMILVRRLVREGVLEVLRLGG
jgi:hypothetical protein